MLSPNSSCGNLYFLNRVEKNQEISYKKPVYYKTYTWCWSLPTFRCTETM